MAGKESPWGPTGQTVSNNVKTFREASALTYAEASRRLEDVGRPIPPLGLRRIEAGERRVDVDDLMALAFVLNTSPTRLLMPPTASRAVTNEATALGQQRSSDLWMWALGNRGLGTDLPALREFRIRSKPRIVLTRSERFERRREWIDDRLVEMKVEEGEALESGTDDFPFQSDLAALRERIELFEGLDPEDDEQFAKLVGGDDPAPPSPEELAGELEDNDNA